MSQSPAPKHSLTIDMPGVDFAGMAREAIAAKLTEALIGADDAITRVVVAAMEQKVEGNGQPSRYSDPRNTSYVEWLAQDLIRSATKQALQDRVERLRPALEAQIEKQLAKNVKSIAASLTESFIKQATAGYGVNVNLTAEMRVRD
jgi:mRNA-degrading endonuclease toxin of MazEF toxin-antitoxin module